MRESGDFMRDARASVFGQMGTCVGGMILLLLTSAILLGCSAWVDDLYGEYSPQAVLCSIVVEILLGALWFGFYASCLKAAQEGNFDISRLFISFTSGGRFLKMLLLVIAENIFLTLWSILFIIPGIVKWYAYSVSYFVRLENPEFSTLETITESRRLMDGNKWRLLKLQCSFLGWFLLCCVTLGIASLWIAPYYYTAKAHFYLEIKAEKAEEEPLLLEA